MHAARQKVCAPFAQRTIHVAKCKTYTGLERYLHSIAHAVVHAKIVNLGDTAMEGNMEVPAELAP